MMHDNASSSWSNFPPTPFHRPIHGCFSRFNKRIPPVSRQKTMPQVYLSLLYVMGSSRRVGVNVKSEKLRLKLTVQHQRALCTVPGEDGERSPGTSRRAPPASGSEGYPASSSPLLASLGVSLGANSRSPPPSTAAYRQSHCLPPTDPRTLRTFPAAVARLFYGSTTSSATLIQPTTRPTPASSRGQLSSGHTHPDLPYHRHQSNNPPIHQSSHHLHLSDHMRTSANEIFLTPTWSVERGAWFVVHLILSYHVAPSMTTLQNRSIICAPADPRFLRWPPSLICVTPVGFGC